MTKNDALRNLFARMRDFSAWTDNSETPIPVDYSTTSETIEAHLPEIAAFIRARFSRVKKADPYAWKVGGWKREELDEAFAILGLAPLE